MLNMFSMSISNNKKKSIKFITKKEKKELTFWFMTTYQKIPNCLTFDFDRVIIFFCFVYKDHLIFNQKTAELENINFHYISLLTKQYLCSCLSLCGLYITDTYEKHSPFWHCSLAVYLESMNILAPQYFKCQGKVVSTKNLWPPLIFFIILFYGAKGF